MSYLINSSFGPEDMERATVPFILACAAANRGPARAFLTGDALIHVVNGRADGLVAEREECRADQTRRHSVAATFTAARSDYCTHSVGAL